jgi:hypothetical protein
VRAFFDVVVIVVSMQHKKIKQFYNFLTEKSHPIQQNTGKQSVRIGEGPILTLEHVERHQAGVYQCTAENGVGEPVNIDMRLDVLCKYQFYCIRSDLGYETNGVGGWLAGCLLGCSFVITIILLYT